MNQDFQTMLRLFAYGATGAEKEIDPGFHFDAVMAYAEEQGVWELVFYAIQQLVRQGAAEVPEAQFADVQKQMLASCIRHAAVLEKSHRVIRALEEAGVPCCVLKGESLAQLYYKPECRVSGDVDLFIDKKHEFTACRVLQQDGYLIETKSEGANHYNCQHKQFGELELHVTLYYDVVRDVWFDNVPMVTEPFCRRGDIFTLGATDGYLYTILHAVTHFLSNGLGVRHIMDVALYAQRYGAEIDHARVGEVLAHLKYQGFVSAMLGLAQVYFGIETDAPYSAKEVEKLMACVEAGGLFGLNRQDQDSLFEIYTKLRFQTFKKQDYQAYMTHWRRRNILQAMSFAPKNMYRYYSYASRRHWLLPAAWLHHVWTIVSTALRRFRLLCDFVHYRPPAGYSAATEERIQLYKELDMI